MSDVLEENDGKFSLSCRNITKWNLLLVDDIDALAEEEHELNVLVKRVDKTCERYIRWR